MWVSRSRRGTRSPPPRPQVPRGAGGRGPPRPAPPARAGGGGGGEVLPADPPGDVITQPRRRPPIDGEEIAEAHGEVGERLRDRAIECAGVRVREDARQIAPDPGPLLGEAPAGGAAD